MISSMDAVLSTMYMMASGMAKSKKKAWSKAEDAALLELIEQHGTSNWTTISECLVKRTGKQCR